MKKAILIILTILLILLVAAIANFDTVLDLLHVDQSGWISEEDNYFYLDKMGDPLTSWQTVDGKLYYFDIETGAMVTGWMNIDRCRYYLNESGQPVTGWQTINDKQYYFGENGIMATGLLITEDSRFYFDDNGQPITCWQPIDGENCYIRADGIIHTGWLEEGSKRYYLDENGAMITGWIGVDGNKYYIDESGAAATGWLVTDDGRYYLEADGAVHYGWLELDGFKYYMLPETGCAAVGKHKIDDVTYYFTATGANIILVNPWNHIPEDYRAEFTTLENGERVSAEMYDALMLMITDCENAGHNPYIASATVVSAPKTSEHQLGLAVDITDGEYTEFDSGVEETETHQWLSEHCWEYGFIVRYPDGKSDITGTTYEPWHYRYVGPELSLVLRDSGLCLEEYLDLLTNDGTTCGNPEA